MTDDATRAKVFIGDAAGDLSHALLRSFEYIGLDDALSTSRKIFVKPNFTFPRPIRGVTTSLDILKTTLALLSNSGAEVFVGESNGGYGSFTAEEAFKGHGLYEICRQTRTEPLNLSKLESRCRVARHVAA